MRFERGKETREVLKIGKFRDCIFVKEIYHTRHKNAKYGTYAKFRKEKNALKNLEKVCGLRFPITMTDILHIAFRTEDGIKDLFEMEGAKIVYKNKIYKLPNLSTS